jgi:hypothetical protein
LPQSIACIASGSNNPALLSSAATIHLTGVGAGSSVAIAAVARYQILLQATGTSTGAVKVITLAVNTVDKSLDRATNYSYTLSYTRATAATVVQGAAASPFGVGYALETLLQLAEPSSQLECGSVLVVGPKIALEDGIEFHTFAPLECEMSLRGNQWLWHTSCSGHSLAS